MNGFLTRIVNSKNHSLGAGSLMDINYFCGHVEGLCYEVYLYIEAMTS